MGDGRYWSGDRPAPVASPANWAVKAIRALRRRAEREASGHFWVEGIRLVAEAVELAVPIETLVVAPDLLSSGFARDVVERARQSAVPVLEVTPRVFAGISERAGPQGIGAVVRQAIRALPEIEANAGLCWIALDRVADPGNLGAIVRTADAVGAAGIILVGSTTDPYDPVAVRASMGAVLSVVLVRAGEHETIAWLGRHGVRTVGTSDSGPVDYRLAEYEPPLALLLGNEREGLSPGLQAACGEVVRIPMAGRSDSLNLAVATGVLLYEVVRQRQAM